jgi:hypothetical protein
MRVSSRVEARPHNRARSNGRYPGFQKGDAPHFPEKNVTLGSTIYTNGLKSFAGLQQAGFQHVPRPQPLRIELRRGAKSVLPLADRAMGNLQQWLIEHITA